MGTALWVVFCFVALAAIVAYLVMRRPRPWFGRDRSESYPYIIGDPDRLDGEDDGPH